MHNKNGSVSSKVPDDKAVVAQEDTSLSEELVVLNEVMTWFERLSPAGKTFARQKLHVVDL